ncbi:MAG: hypothetical protein V3U14_12835 [candidate division NC10 bacterium]
MATGTSTYEGTGSGDRLYGISWTDSTIHFFFFEDTGGNDDWQTGTIDTGPTALEWTTGSTSLVDFADPTSISELGPDWVFPPFWKGGASSVATVGAYTVVGSGTPTTATLPGSDDAAGVTIYRDRAYYWAIDANPGRFYYSDIGAFSTVASTSFIDDLAVDVTSTSTGIIGAWVVQGSLFFATRDNSWYSLTGESPVTGTIRYRGQAQTPDYAGGVVVDDRVLFLDTLAQGFHVVTPGSLMGGVSHLSPTAYPGSTSERPDPIFDLYPGLSDYDTKAVFLPGTNSHALERVNGVWNVASSTNVFAACLGPGGRMAHGFATNSNIAFRDFTLNRPGNSGDTYSVALNTNPIVDLGEIEASGGRLVRPVKVVFDVDYWKGGNYSSPVLKVDATVKGLEADTSEVSATQITVATSAWDDTTGDAPSARRVSIALEELAFGVRTHIRVTLNNLALNVVQVYYEEDTDPR